MGRMIQAINDQRQVIDQEKAITTASAETKQHLPQRHRWVSSGDLAAIGGQGLFVPSALEGLSSPSLFSFVFFFFNIRQ
jgi:hypothetical protein